MSLPLHDSRSDSVHDFHQVFLDEFLKYFLNVIMNFLDDLKSSYMNSWLQALHSASNILCTSTSECRYKLTLFVAQ